MIILKTVPPPPSPPPKCPCPKMVNSFSEILDNGKVANPPFSVALVPLTKQFLISSCTFLETEKISVAPKMFTFGNLNKTVFLVY